MRRAARVDENQNSIVKALRAHGCDVLSLAAVGKGCPDLLVSRPYYPHHLSLLEIKNPDQDPNKRKLKPAQLKFHAEWKGPIHVVTSVQEALDAVGIVRTGPRNPQ